MLRLEIKSALILETCNIYANLSRFKNCTSKSFEKIARKSLVKDFKKGLKEIDKKVKVFVELPKVESVGNGMTTEKKEEKNVEKQEIIVRDSSCFLVDKSN